MTVTAITKTAGRVLLGGMVAVALSVAAWAVFTLIYRFSTGVSVSEVAPQYGAYFGVATAVLSPLLTGWRVARGRSRPALMGLAVGLTYAVLQSLVSILLGPAPLNVMLLRSIAGVVGGAVGGLMAGSRK